MKLSKGKILGVLELRVQFEVLAVELSSARDDTPLIPVAGALAPRLLCCQIRSKIKSKSKDLNLF